jgi:F0F1-type ATP synthase assembly protein I
MKIAPAVKKETGHIALGTAIGVVLILIGFFVVKQFNSGVLVSAIIGGVVAVLNFFILGLTVQKIANGESEERGRKWMQFSYNMRMLVMVIWLIVALAVPFFNWVAALLPLLMPRLTIAVMQVTGIYKKPESEQ